MNNPHIELKTGDRVLVDPGWCEDGNTARNVGLGLKASIVAVDGVKVQYDALAGKADEWMDINSVQLLVPTSHDPAALPVVTVESIAPPAAAAAKRGSGRSPKSLPMSSTSSTGKPTSKRKSGPTKPTRPKSSSSSSSSSHPIKKYHRIAEQNILANKPATATSAAHMSSSSKNSDEPIPPHCSSAPPQVAAAAKPFAPSTAAAAAAAAAAAKREKAMQLAAKTFGVSGRLGETMAPGPARVMSSSSATSEGELAALIKQHVLLAAARAAAFKQVQPFSAMRR